MSSPDEVKPARRGIPVWAFVPLILFAVLAAIFYKQLYAGDPTAIPSALIGRPAPEFSLPPVEGLTVNGQPVPGLSRADLLGQVTVVNVWASWCGPCRDEHPLLMVLAEDTRFKLVGIDYKDLPANATRFLNALGNPFSAVGSDRSGRVGIDWGVYGVPETFVIDGQGRIAFKHVGPIQNDDLEAKLLPAIRAAGG